MIERAVISMLVVLASCSLASAQDAAMDEARRQFEAGTEAFDTGDYEAAVSAFQAAYALTEHPDLLFNIYSSAERAGQLEVAASALARFLDEGEVEAERRPVLEQRLARVRERLRARAEPDEQSGAEASVELSSPPEPAASDDEPAMAVHPAGIVTLIGAGVLGAAFGVLAVLSELEDGNLAAGCGARRSCTSDDVATLNALNIAADVTWITAASVAVIGVVLLLTLPPDADEGAQTAFAPWVTPQAAGLAAVGRF